MADERWLVTGAAGQLGGYLVFALRRRGAACSVSAVVRRSGVSIAGVETVVIDLREAQSLREHVVAFEPTHVLHVGAMTAVADAFANPEAARKINADATETLALAAGRVGARFVFASTDMVFDGESAPYGETDEPGPLSQYGRSKREAERRLADMEHTLVVRLPLLYGFPMGRRATTFTRQVAALRAGEALRLFTDEYRTPLYLGDASAALIALGRSHETGTIHVAGPERLSRYEMGERFARALGIRSPKLVACSRNDFEACEPRPADLSLDGSRFVQKFPALAPAPLPADAFKT